MTNTSQTGTKPGETRAGFIVKAAYLTAIKYHAQAQGKKIKEVVNECLELYLAQNYDLNNLPQEPLQEITRRGGEKLPKQLGEITYYTLQELSEELDVTLQTLRKYIRQGKLRGQKVANQWYVTEEALRNFLESRD